MTHAPLIKCLRNGGRSVHSFVDAQGYNGWDLPRDDQPGAWKGPVKGDLRPHHNGLHLAKKDYFIDWLTGHHYLAETDGETVEGLDCVIARRARLVEHLPVDHTKMAVFFNNQLDILPAIMEGLHVYPNISQDVQHCVSIIKMHGVENAHKPLKHSQSYKFIQQNNSRLSYDELHSIEYNHCTKAARTCLETIVAVHNMSEKGDGLIDLTKVISNKVAKATDALHINYQFMEGLCERGYDHNDEVKAMKSFLTERDLLIYTGVKTPKSKAHTYPIPGFFQRIRQRQNKELLPALGL